MPKLSRREALASVGALAGIGGAGCLGSDNGDDGTITIGAVESLTGPLSPFGTSHLQGLEYAIDEINADGGVIDRELELVSGDDQTNPQEAETLFRNFVEQEDAVLITGPCADMGVRVRPTADELQTPHIMHMAGAINAENPYTFWFGNVPAGTKMKAYADFIVERGLEPARSIVADTAWGQSVEAAIDQFIPDDFDHETHTTAMTTEDFTPILRDVPDDLAVMETLGHPEGAIAIAGQQFELGIQPEYTLSPTVPPGVWADALGEAVTNGIVLSHLPDTFSDRYVETGQEYGAETGDPFHTHVAVGYETGHFIADAIRNADSTDSTEIRDAIRESSYDGLYERPVEYVDVESEQNLVKDPVLIFAEFDLEPAPYFDEADWRLSEITRTDPLEQSIAV